MVKLLYAYDKAREKSFLINVKHIVWIDINTKQVALSDGTIITASTDTMVHIIEEVRNNKDYLL